MKNILLSIFLFSVAQNICAQAGKEMFILYNKDWSQTQNNATAVYFMQRKDVNDTTHICRFYQMNGPMIQMETYRDTALDIRHGLFAWYNLRGDLDSMGTFYYGQKDKTWDFGFTNATHTLRLTEKYDKNILKEKIDYVTKKIYKSDGTEEILDITSNMESKPDRNGHIESGAQFKNGGLKGWSNYLSKHLKYPSRLMQLTGMLSDKTVIAGFDISKDGIITSVYILHSCEWSADMEALRVISESPSWEPAIRDGKPIDYRHRQSIDYSVVY
jgi:hypothetical protein